MEEKRDQGKDASLPEYEQKYSIRLLILMFFTFSVIGWMWEVGLHLFKHGTFVNRGVLLGPWLPIYGTGGIVILLFFRRIYNRPVLLFFTNMIVSSAIEYFTSWYLQETRGIRWWNYSGYFLNINGRICLEGAVIFGLAGCLVVYILAPLLSRLYQRIVPQVQILLCAVLLGMFFADMIHSYFHPNIGKGITTTASSQKKSR